MLFRVLLVFITVQFQNALLAEEYFALTSEVVKILNHTLKDSDDSEAKIELDKTILLYELTETDNKIDCMRIHSGYTLETNQKLLGQVETGHAKFKIVYPNIDLSKYSPELVSLEKGQSRTLILKGEYQGEQVYFRLEINDKKEAFVYYVPIDEKAKTENEIVKAIPVFEDLTPPELKKLGHEGEKRVKGVKGEIKIGDKGSELQWKTVEGESAATLVVKADGSPEKVTIGLKKKGEEAEELSGSLDTELSGVKTSLRAKLKDEETALGGTVSIADKDSEVSASLDQNGESTATKVKGKTKIGPLDLSAEHSGSLEDEKFKINTKAGINIDDNQRLNTTYETNEKSEDTIGVEYTYTTDDKKTKVAIASKAIIVDENETEFESQLRLTHKTSNDLDTITLSMTPSGRGGDLDSVRLESRLDRKISDDATIGLYAKTTFSEDETKENSDIGVQFKSNFGGPDKNIEMLKVYTLYQVDVKENEDGPFQMAYYQVWYYHCNLKKMKLKIEKPKKRLFLGYVLEDMANSAYPIHVDVPKEYTIPKGVNKTSFCISK